MNQLISSNFFRVLSETSQTGIAIDTNVLKKCYDEFVMLLFSLSAAFSGKAAFHNTLEYTRVELTSLTEEVSEKKCTCFTKKGYSSYWQTDWIGKMAFVNWKKLICLSIQKTDFIQNCLEMDFPQNVPDWIDVWSRCSRQFQFR